MAVLKNDRNISECEYERTFKYLYKLTSDNIAKVPKRKHKTICDIITKYMNAIFYDILSITEVCGKSVTAKSEKDILIKRSIKRLRKMEEPLLVFWNIEKYPEDKMKRWATLIDTEVSLLSKMLEKGESVVVDMNNMMTINWQQIRRANFMENMSTLHKVVHSKACHLPNMYFDTSTQILLKCVDDAWYSLLKANQRMPKTKADYETRRKLISEAISNLYKLQRPLATFFNIMGYSENTINYISKLLTDEIKMLQTLQKSDRERFANLK